MKILILTQKVDQADSNLGSFHAWIEEFAREVEKVTVICLEKGEYSLPDNVRVESLGKEKGAGKLARLWRFYFYLFKYISNYDAVFVHMNPEYVILGSLPWAVFGKSVSLWYTHKHVDLKLRLAEKLSDAIFTASQESFRLPSRHLYVVGHGIDTNLFSPGGKREETKVITVGRITESKKIKEIISVVASMRESNPEIHLDIIGAPITVSDKAYKKSLPEHSWLSYVGPKTQTELPEYYRSAGLFLNLSNTGSIDRAVLEALACDTPVVTTNEAFRGIGSIYTNNLSNVPEFAIKKMNAKVGENLRTLVETQHSLAKLIPKMLQIIATHTFGEKRNIFVRHNLIIRYVIAGGTAAAVDLLILSIATSLFGVWYLASAVLAFTLAFIASFLLQKFWVFRDKRTEGANTQLMAYLFVLLINLAANSGLMYFFVDLHHVHYFVAQILSGIIVAIWSFFVYRHFIFNKKAKS